MSLPLHGFLRPHMRNLENGMDIHCLRGHTRVLDALQFDEVKLITGSMNLTLRVWNWHTGGCIRTLECRRDGDRCLNFDTTSTRH